MGQLSRRALLRSLGGLVVLSSCAPAAAPPPSASAAPAAASATGAAPAPSAAPKATKAAGAWVALTSNRLLWPVAVEAGYFKKYGQDFDLQ